MRLNTAYDVNAYERYDRFGIRLFDMKIPLHTTENWITSLPSFKMVLGCYQWTEFGWNMYMDLGEVEV